MVNQIFIFKFKLSLLFLASFIGLSSCAYPQTKEEIIQGFINALKPGGVMQYNLDYSYWDEPSGISTNTIIVTEKFVPADTTIGGYYNYSNKQTGEITVYNGFECLQYDPVNYSSDSALAHNKKAHREIFSDQEIKFGDITGIRPSIVTSSFTYKLSLLGIKNELTNSNIYSLLKDLVLLEDTTIAGQSCFRLGSQFVKLAVNKQTNLPAYFEIKYPTQSWIATYSNYKLNPANTKNLFSRKAFPKGVKFAEYLEYHENYLRAGASAPDFEATTLSGDKFKLSDFRGKPVLLMFTETYCPGCLLSYPKINAFAKQYADLAVIGAYPNDAKSTLEDFVKRKKTNFPIFQDVNKDYKKYGVNGYPTFFLIDRNGIIAYSQVGYSEYFIKAMQKVIESELKKYD